jgi:hypothetical protein
MPPSPTRWCRGCAYPLNGVVATTCPECGKVFDRKNDSTFVTDITGYKVKRFWQKVWPWAALAILLPLLGWDVISNLSPYDPTEPSHDVVKEAFRRSFLIAAPLCVIAYLLVRKRLKR